MNKNLLIIIYMSANFSSPNLTFKFFYILSMNCKPLEAEINPLFPM